MHDVAEKWLFVIQQGRLTAALTLAVAFEIRVDSQPSVVPPLFAIVGSRSGVGSGGKSARSRLEED